ncbi:MAG: hypothetical protein HY554_03870 [Elusimicrobia bacterium]|nr:hypothetical protein [Elusimicrobiota bacterium]
MTSRAGTEAAGDLALLMTGKALKAVKDGGKRLLPGRTAKRAADATDVVADVELVQETSEAARKLLEGFPK